MSQRVITTAAPKIPSGTPANRSDLTGCPWHDAKAKLQAAGLRPTRQRMALGWILFAKGDRHVTAEMLYKEANHANVPLALATVYNTLNLFIEIGLVSTPSPVSL
jgi:Fur family transcriptional regulator, iron response regulator